MDQREKNVKFRNIFAQFRTRKYEFYAKRDGILVENSIFLSKNLNDQ